MTLADTPTTWPTGASMPALHVLLIFVGIPLLVIATVSLLVLAPSWVKGPRYRPGQPWDAKNESFGAALEIEPAVEDGGTSNSAFTEFQRHEISRALGEAERTSGWVFALEVGASGPDTRLYAETRHALLPDPVASIFIQVDPGRRTLEIVTGEAPARVLDERSAGLAALTIETAFTSGYLARELLAGIQQLGQLSRVPRSLHTDTP